MCNGCLTTRVLGLTATAVLTAISKTDAVNAEPDAQPARPQSIEELSTRLGEQAYLADRGLAPEYWE